MKKIFLSILMVTAVQITNAQNKSQVSLVNGIEVYILSEPVRDYEVVHSVGRGNQWLRPFNGERNLTESIETKVENYIKRLRKYCDKKGIAFDAVIYSTGKQMDAIKFTDLKTPENDRISIINNIDGISFFVMSIPIDNYEFIKKIGRGIKFTNSKNLIVHDLMKFAKRAKKESKYNTYNAIIYYHGKTVDLIKI
ncbi:MAG: hypothetical protein IMY67_10685 [Bacteroidetes bacterium]|nr:hypothetical protein [Bacteroidota bacterium]